MRSMNAGAVLMGVMLKTGGLNSIGLSLASQSAISISNRSMDRLMESLSNDAVSRAGRAFREGNRAFVTLSVKFPCPDKLYCKCAHIYLISSM